MMVIKEMKKELELDEEGLADAMDITQKQIKKETA